MQKNPPAPPAIYYTPAPVSDSSGAVQEEDSPKLRPDSGSDSHHQESSSFHGSGSGSGSGSGAGGAGDFSLRTWQVESEQASPVRSDEERKDQKDDDLTELKSPNYLEQQHAKSRLHTPRHS